MKKLLLIAVLCGMAMAYTSCKKDDVTPSQPTQITVHQVKAMDSGGQNDPTPPPPPPPPHP